jgi:hypothetical protein
MHQLSNGTLRSRNNTPVSANQWSKLWMSRPNIYQSNESHTEKSSFISISQSTTRQWDKKPSAYLPVKDTDNLWPQWIKPVNPLNQCSERIPLLFFSSVTFKMPTKKKIYKCFCLLLFEGTFTSFFTDKKSQQRHKTVEIKVFLLFLLDDGRIRIRIRIRTSN